MLLSRRAGKGICSLPVSTAASAVEVPSSRYVIRVRFGETDLMGIAHHSSYLLWFEAARVEYLRRRGVDYGDFVRRGVNLPVIEAGLRYRRAARFDERLVVEARVSELTGATVRFDYRVLREADGELLTEGHTTLACVDDAHRPRRIPSDVRELLMSPERAPREPDRV